MENPHPISIASLVTGLVEDLRRLFAQEVQLARHEMQHELGKVVKSAMHAGIAMMLFIWIALLYVIVAFADIGEFIDTPVKRYSSGMQVKLAFAVATEVSLLLATDCVYEWRKRCVRSVLQSRMCGLQSLPARLPGG